MAAKSRATPLYSATNPPTGRARTNEKVYSYEPIFVNKPPGGNTDLVYTTDVKDTGYAAVPQGLSGINTPTRPIQAHYESISGVTRPSDTNKHLSQAADSVIIQSHAPRSTVWIKPVDSGTFARRGVLQQRPRQRIARTLARHVFMSLVRLLALFCLGFLSAPCKISPRQTYAQSRHNQDLPTALRLPEIPG